MSLCDRCMKPGHCCENIKFFSSAAGRNGLSFWADSIESTVTDSLHQEDKDAGRPMPFRVKEITGRWTVAEGEEEAGREYVTATFSCINLQPDGRCGDYENRPWLCRFFKSGIDWPCIHYGFSAEGEADDLVPLPEDFDIGLLISETIMDPDAPWPEPEQAEKAVEP